MKRLPVLLLLPLATSCSLLFRPDPATVAAGQDASRDGSPDAARDVDVSEDGDDGDADGDEVADSDAENAADSDVDDGSTGDADAGPDAGPDADPDPTSCDDGIPGLIFCDGFEGGLSAWRSSEDGGSVRLETTDVFRGAGALRVEVHREGGRAAVSRSFPAPLHGPELHLRLRLMAPASSELEHLSFATVIEDAWPWNHVSVMVVHDGPAVWVHEPGTYFGSEGAELARDRWVCVQAHITVADDAGRVRVAVDGSTAIDAGPTDTHPAGGFASLNVGLPYTPTHQGPTVLLLDEVALGTAPIPCD